MSDSKRSFTSSSSRDEALRRTTKIVNSFLANEELTPFREPVDWRGLELMDYTQVVKKPMDLGTIKRRLDRLQYSCAAEVAHDIRLVWKNCMRCVRLLATVVAARGRAMFALIFDIILAHFNFPSTATMLPVRTFGTSRKVTASDSKIATVASAMSVCKHERNLVCCLCIVYSP